MSNEPENRTPEEVRPDLEADRYLSTLFSSRPPEPEAEPESEAEDRLPQDEPAPAFVERVRPLHVSLPYQSPARPNIARGSSAGRRGWRIFGRD